MCTRITLFGGKEGKNIRLFCQRVIYASYSLLIRSYTVEYLSSGCFTCTHTRTCIRLSILEKYSEFCLEFDLSYNGKDLANNKKSLINYLDRHTLKIILFIHFFFADNYTCYNHFFHFYLLYSLFSSSFFLNLVYIKIVVYIKELNKFLTNIKFI